MKSVVAIVQARLTSSRLPNKVLADVGGMTAFDLMFRRMSRSQHIETIVVAIPDTPENDPLAAYLETTLKVPFVRGDEDDVLSRYVKASKIFPAKYYLRLTADCPFICPEIIDSVVQLALDSAADYSSNVEPASFPDGFDVECISARALNWIDLNVSNPHHREHVTYGFRICKNRPSDFVMRNYFRNGESMATIRLTLDEERDLYVIKCLVEHFGSRSILVGPAELEQAYLDLRLARINGEIVRNEGLAISTKNYFAE